MVSCGFVFFFKQKTAYELRISDWSSGVCSSDLNAALCKIITDIAIGLNSFSTDSDTLGDAYEYLIGQFAAGSGKKAGEFYTPQFVSDILSEIVALDGQAPATGKRAPIDSLLEPACGAGSLLQLGGAARRGSVCHVGKISGGAESLKKK